MESKGELKEIYIKNRVYHYFDDIINGIKINFSNTLLGKKSYEHISFNISQKTTTGPKPLRIRFDKIDGCITSLDGKIKHLILLDYGLFNKICEKIKYPISTKSGIRNCIDHNLERSELHHIIIYLLKNIDF